MRACPIQQPPHPLRPYATTAIRSGDTHEMPTVLITGASTGIGRATALRLAGSGWTVLAGVRRVNDGDALVVAGGERIIPIILDVTDAAQIDAAVEEVGEHGRLDALVNNAGSAIGGPLELLSLDDLRRQFDVNFFGHVALTQALIPALRRARGRIVLISSIGGLVATPYRLPITPRSTHWRRWETACAWSSSLLTSRWR